LQVDEELLEKGMAFDLSQTVSCLHLTYWVCLINLKLTVKLRTFILSEEIETG